MANSVLSLNRTPDHPPYAEMIRDAIMTLDEEGGSNESSISSFIKVTYTDLPVAHDNLLSYHLSKLTLLDEVTQPVPGLYTLPNFQTPVNPNPKQPLALALVKESTNPSPLADRSNSCRHRRGRPPNKKLPDVEEAMALLPGLPAIDCLYVPPQRRRGRPPKPKAHGPIGTGVVLDGEGHSGLRKARRL